ncbi:MAG: hypothetical protein MJ180_01395 [Candidatus Gastranaerophilales bacterium]|nr:hypothetical protein [Candidatus Gastranaerophilales bacterium]
MTNLNSPTRLELANTFSSFLPMERVNRTFLPQNRESKRHKFERKYGMLYTGVSVAAGGGILYALHRGGQLFNFTNFLKKHFTKYQAKTFNKLGEYPFFQKIRYATGSGISYVSQKMLEFGNIVGNMNPFKDIAFNRFTGKIGLNPFLDRVTAFFTKSAKKLTLSKYERAGEDLLKFRNCLGEVITKLNAKGGANKALAEKLAGYSHDLEEEMQKIVGQNFTQRFDNTVSMLNNHTEEQFLEVFKRSKDKSFFGTLFEKVKECGDFLPAKVMEKYKNLLFKDLNGSKMKISNSILDLCQTLSKSIDDIFYSAPFKNEKISQSYLKIRDLLTQFKDPSILKGKRAIIRANLIKELEKASIEFSAMQNGNTKTTALNHLIKIISEDKKGMVEEAVSLCKALKKTDPELYKELIKTRNQFQHSFNEAINFETDKTYRKLLDFSLHSLPTDFLTIFAGIGGVGYVLANRRKSRREKMRTNIEKGIPVLGGIAVSFLSNMRMVASGTGAIFLGLVSGIALNRIGRTINHYYMKKEFEEKMKNRNIA